ncbi:class I adenylate-forming enzyme family protein [Sulfitobacter guttiformis]|uniref:Long-chain acyl-CoA synthetase n=1 Tax=Sulfitobacter guttiformis TaxID=74349 RepID=A0A420DIW4_9RHOB|nr:AMP-binding protein [Sulfitobacter guttiformis]KIN72058.1 AMP-binding domain protein [Sulfitobacter guttiformis KCTC 32187]RKE94162.1 long-chain acyl-CoA synthetase [Sulfitobacter guttiformis]
MNIAHWLERRAHHDPARAALYHGKQCFADYATFDARARAMAAGLQARGVHAGDRVAIFMGNHPDWLIALYAILYAGAAAVPMNAKLHGREARIILENSGAYVCFTDAAHFVELKAAGVTCACIMPPDMEADGASVEICHREAGDLAWLFYTSGTTGTPKGVMITHGMLQAMSLSYGMDVDCVQAHDAALYAAPLSHGAGLYNFIHVQAGARHVCPVSGGFDSNEVLELAAYFGRCHMFAAPTMVTRLTRTAKAVGLRGEGLRTVVYAGGPMYTADIIEAVDHFGPVFVQIYGQGECPMAITALSRHDVADRRHPDWYARLGSVGRAQSVVEVQIADSDGRPVAAGSSGEILVRGAPVMRAYWGNPEATSRTLRDGWLMTGDIGYLDVAGYLTLQDRSKDVIITGGSNVYPREVEEVLLRHPQVTEVSVVGARHADWGEEVVAFVVGDASEVELDTLCLENIARFKRPKRYIRLDELPKNNYGKTLKTDLRSYLSEA